MRGYCPKCREYRSDNGADAWGIIWNDDLPFCQRCNSLIDMWPNSNGGTSRNSRERKSGKVSRPKRGQRTSFLSLERSMISENTTSAWSRGFCE